MTHQAAALQALDSGRPVVMPTDTVYGVAARTDRPAALTAIFRLKGRPTDKALPVLAASADDLAGIVSLDERARTLGARFWPGPLTLVLPRAEGFDADLGGEGSTVAVRVPSCEVALQLLSAAGPLAVTSANHSGSAPAATVDEARRAFGSAVPVYLDAGRKGGRPSSVVSLGTGTGTEGLGADPKLLRDGPIALADVLDALGPSTG
jgi:L-threonylcarbamoyladenylate synthase